MSYPEAKLYCSNTQCQALNPANSRFCEKCRTPLVKRYLWAVGAKTKTLTPGQLIGERYLWQHSKWFLDTKPSLAPFVPEEVPEQILPYLKLIPYRLHIPQVYGQLVEKQGNRGIWLLEYSNLSRAVIENIEQGKPLTQLTQAWHGQKPLRQLNWLWQIVQLWQPLKVQGVVSTLLDTSLLQVKGAIVNVQELKFDHGQPSIQALGQVWSDLIVDTAPSIQSFLQEICQRLESGNITSPEKLSDVLNQGIGKYGSYQENTYHIFARTDIGRNLNRDSNEDDCYPRDGEQKTFSHHENALGIVCDGIGGHEGGEVASHLAIEEIEQAVKNLAIDRENPQPEAVKNTLENYICQVNDQISDRNDREKRHERQRMGTTVVMTLARGQEMYITHVGDSRVYWITRHGCHQVTLDDDVASREVRLGYALYRDAVKYPAAGSLVQALGMGSSENLRPTAQRIIIDEECIFLLCTDGLSDNDRVEQYWETEILPILSGRTDITQVSEKLINLANQTNGHDNVTVALVHCQVEQKRGASYSNLSPSSVREALPSNLSRENTQLATSSTNLNQTIRSWAWLAFPFVIVFSMVGVFFASDLEPVQKLMPESVNREINGIKSFLHHTFFSSSEDDQEKEPNEEITPTPTEESPQIPGNVTEPSNTDNLDKPSPSPSPPLDTTEEQESTNGSEVGN